MNVGTFTERQVLDLAKQAYEGGTAKFESTSVE